MNTKRTSHFVVSLDLELFWGMIDKTTLAAYGEHIENVRIAIPAILERFSRYGIHATWATVGMLMYETKDGLRNDLPDPALRPSYDDPTLSSYEHLEHEQVGDSEQTDPYHFGASLIETIRNVPNQEIGSHTFSHYYCLDGGGKNSRAVFAADCDAMNRAAARFDIIPRSLVLPRNQEREQELKVAREHGIQCYRGNEDHFLYRPRKDSEQTLLIRGLRLLDHYMNISGYHTFHIVKKTDALPTNVPSSRFLRPWNKKLSFLEPLRRRRITRAMTHAARRGESFHLWWHPHNFGADLNENIKTLTYILEHYKKLQAGYGMQSATMAEAANK